MQPGMSAGIAAADVDPVALAQSPLARRPLDRRTITFVLIGLLAYVIGLIALIPASTVVAGSDRLKVGGTIWRGEAVLGSAIQIDWTFAPLTTLTHLGFSADWHMRGGATDLAGKATQGTGGVLRLDDVSGQADGTLLVALAPRLPIACTVLADVAIDTITIGGSAQRAEGRLRTSPAKCAMRSGLGTPVDLPALSGEITPTSIGSSGALMTALRREDLVEVRWSRNGAISVWPTPMAVRLAPVLSGMRYDGKID